MQRVKIGIVGCGNISGNYLKNAQSFPILEVAALADMIPDRAQAKAQEFNIPRACSVDELLADPEIKIVVNLTIPKAHAEVALKAVEAGKSVYNEKPLAVTREDGKKIVTLAKQKKVLVGGAPDTFFGAGHQTARKLIDDGAIGKPVAATAFMMGRGHETWHPAPEFYYKPGGGPMLDMGPYYLTDLVQLLGPIKRVAGITSFAIPERTITSQPKFGTKIAVETPDHVAGTVEFHGGCVATVIMTFAVMFAEQHPITIYGTEGTMKVPDPNGFDGEVKVKKPGDADWGTVPFTHTTGYGRSVGVADMAYSLLRPRRKHRASGQLCFGVLDAMLGFLDSSTKGKAHKVVKHDRPAALPAGLAMGVLDE